MLTDGNLYDPHIFDFIESYIQGIMDYISSYGITLPSQTVLVLEQRDNGKCGYYFADHSHQCIFWLDGFDANSLVYEVKTCPTTSHLGEFYFYFFPLESPSLLIFLPSGQEIRSQYWYVCEMLHLLFHSKAAAYLGSTMSSFLMYTTFRMRLSGSSRTSLHTPLAVSL